MLRYWETEFPALQGGETKGGQRVYSEREVALLARIKELLYDEGYTIAGAKKRLEAEIEELGDPQASLIEPEDGDEGEGGVDDEPAEDVEPEDSAGDGAAEADDEDEADDAVVGEDDEVEADDEQEDADESDAAESDADDAVEEEPAPPTRRGAKPRTGRRKAASAASDAAAAVVDTKAQERIEKLELGIRNAIRELRQIRTLLDSAESDS